MSELPAGWAETTIGDTSEYISRGKSPKYTVQSSLPIVNQRAIRWFGIQQEHLKYVDAGQISSWGAERYIREGDVLWNSTGTGTIGRACLVARADITPPKVVDTHVTIVRPRTDVVDPRYLFAWIRGPVIQNSIVDMATGTTNQIELSRTAIAERMIPLAPLQEQSRIAAKLHKLLSDSAACRERLDQVPQILKKFREAVLEAAVSGRLTEEWRESRRLTRESWIRSTVGSVI